MICVAGVTIPPFPPVIPPRPMPRSRSTSSSLMVTLPPPPSHRFSMIPLTLNLGGQVESQGHMPQTMSRSISQPAVPLVPGSPLTHTPVYQSMPPTPSSISDPIADNENNECTVCYERPVNFVLYTCGHMCMCFECAQAVRKERNPLCPICRQEIKDVIKIYRS
ncbi:hypothetical protein DPMN_164501 [Dreissena polymorpha]|uniref:RING-type domain-containing protein n=1 Tax=Dreissena polymorpha TaxID=45954 RepID=A0A9D4IVH0_DREPO|nr:hypothetical protein DPMN_164501 [Dreissena polymorpha]